MLWTMKVETISEAKAQLSSLVDRALAGEEVIIGRAGRPVVRLVALVEGGEQRKAGSLAGKLWIADDFDELPRDIALAFGLEP